MVRQGGRAHGHMDGARGRSSLCTDGLVGA